MCGGSKPKKPEPTASEQTQARIAVDDLRRFEDVFVPLEREAIAHASPETRAREEALISGRANADIYADAATAQNANTVNLRQGADAFVTGIGSVQRGTDAAAGSGRTQAAIAAGDRATQRELDVVKTGRGMARTVSSGISRAADLEVSSEQAHLRAKAIKDKAKMDAFNQMVGTAAAVGAAKYSPAASKSEVQVQDSLRNRDQVFGVGQNNFDMRLS